MYLKQFLLHLIEINNRGGAAKKAMKQLPIPALKDITELVEGLNRYLTTTEVLDVRHKKKEIKKADSAFIRSNSWMYIHKYLFKTRANEL
jgi:hypothetical protein